MTVETLNSANATHVGNPQKFSEELLIALNDSAGETRILSRMYDETNKNVDNTNRLLVSGTIAGAYGGYHSRDSVR
jgi:hypothetical protein